MSGDELHEAINAVIIDQTWVTYERVGQDAVVAGSGLAADAILALPEMQTLLAKDAEIVRLRAVIKNAARDLYRAEVHRQGVGWDDFCTSLLVRSQHALAAETIWQEARRG